MDIKKFEVNSGGQELIIDIQIPDTPEFQNTIIEKIAIQDHNHYTKSYPNNPQTEILPADSLEEKKFTKTIHIQELNITTTGLYFIYVSFTDISMNEPNSVVSKKGAIDLFPLYNKASKLIATSLSNCGEGREELIDLYLQQQMILQALELDEYDTAIAIFNRLLFESIREGRCIDMCYEDNQAYHTLLSFAPTC